MHANWVQTSLENATWDPFGTETRPDGLQGAHPHSGYPDLWDLLGGKCRSKAALWPRSGTSNGAQNVVLRLNLHLDHRKMRFWEWCLKTSEIE